MDAVLRASAIYLFLLLIFRLAGRRTLAEMTAFDFIFLLIIGESTQQAMLADDLSVTHGLLVIVTLVTIDIGLSLVKQRWHAVDKVLDGLPTLLVENGRMLEHRMDMSRIDEEDILEAARKTHGLERLDQIKYAVLERSGGISIIPWR
jgi:uncharacterized membrane protein YcaP (DUF421 family)